MFKLILCILGVAFVNGLYTEIPTGFVGVVHRFGKTQQDLKYPGLNFYNAWTSSVKLVEIKPQTDSVQRVDCISKEGVALVFESIEVGNKLPATSVVGVIENFGFDYDKYLVTDLVRHQINVICSSMTYQDIFIDKFDELDDQLRMFIQLENEKQKTGLEIMFVRLTKPQLPRSLNEAYLKLSEEKIQKKVVEERSIREMAEKTHELNIKRQDDLMKMEAVKAEIERNLEESKSLTAKQQISNDNKVSEAEANFKAETQRIEILRLENTIPGVIEEKIARLTSPTRIYFGEKIPDQAYFSDMRIDSK
jgi:regulator of protease activity HflC (stomatin/prohibitin superfamily)